MQVDPNVVDFLDVDGLAKHIIKTTGVPASVVRGAEEVAAIREQKQQMQAQMAPTHVMNPNHHQLHSKMYGGFGNFGQSEQPD